MTQTRIFFKEDELVGFAHPENVTAVAVGGAVEFLPLYAYTTVENGAMLTAWFAYAGPNGIGYFSIFDADYAHLLNANNDIAPSVDELRQLVSTGGATHGIFAPPSVQPTLQKLAETSLEHVVRAYRAEAA